MQASPARVGDALFWGPICPSRRSRLELQRQKMMLPTEPLTPVNRRRAVPVAALSFFTCFLLALAGHGLQPAPREIGKVAVSNRDAGTATIPRQGTPVRIASASDRDHAKSPLAGGGLGLPLAALAIIAAAPAGAARAVSSRRPTVDVAHFPRGPPLSAS